MVCPKCGGKKYECELCGYTQKRRLKMTKILIGTPICKQKMYCWKEYVNAIKSLKVPMGMIGHIYIVDTSDEIDAVKFEVEDESFIYKHLCLWQISRNDYAKKMDKIVAARNEIFEYATKFKYDYVLFVDSDVIVPKDTIPKLMLGLNSNCACYKPSPIISGFYPGMTEYGLPIPSAKLILKGKITDFPDTLIDGKIHRVNLIGLGCCLIPKEIFTKLKFRCERGKYGDLLKSEDWCFCEDLANADILFDTGLVAKHKIIEESNWDPEKD